MSSRPNPFDELDRMFDRVSRQFGTATGRWGGEEGGLLGSERAPAIDLVEEDDAFVVTIDVPGFDPEEIDLRTSEESLWVEVERGESSEEVEDDYLRRERRRSSMRRSVGLPARVKPEEVEATLRNGILTVRLPKAKRASESRRVEIEGA